VNEFAGLSTKEARDKLVVIGPNTLPEKQPPRAFVIFLRQLKSPLVYILLIASVITYLIGHQEDSLIILLAVMINSVLGFIQEKRAGNALTALNKMLSPDATVIRDGVQMVIPVEQIVPDDICILNQGYNIPADGVLFEANRLFISDAALTGESVPVEKKAQDKVFMGTTVTSGRGFMKAEVTGEKTEIGRIATSVQEPIEDTPLRRQMGIFSKQLTILVVGLTAFVFVVGLLSGSGFIEIFSTSVALAVSAIPEGLLIGLTVVLAVGMQRILKRKGLVRNLVSAETLGGVTTICLDKTGTLTEGKMQVVEILGDKQKINIQAILANDLDDPIVVALWEYAVKKIDKRDMGGKKIDEFVKQNTRIDSLPFSSSERFFASLNKTAPNHHTLFVNGAPEFLMDWSNLSTAKKNEINNKIKEYSHSGMRLMGMAQKSVGTSVTRLDSKIVKSGLTWLGLIAFTDPIRTSVQSALVKTQKAGIKSIVITGDYAQTAKAVMQNLNLKVTDEQIMLGSELAKLSPEKLAEFLKLKDIRLFARTTPDQKLKIVMALKAQGEIIAMMGDGVNDAPALQKADIGIVVGDATDVARETADLVLLDSNFATVVAAVEEGRGIFDNIRKIILYLMSGAFSEIVAVVGSILLALPLPVTAVQILWINLVSDGFPHLALTVDPNDPASMDMPPRSKNEQLVMGWMKILIAIVSIFSGLSALMIFLYIFKTTHDEILARSIAFLLLGVNSLIYVFSVRTLQKPIWESDFLSNRWLLLSVAGGLVLQFLPFTTEFFADFFNVKWPGIGYVLLVVAISLLIVIFIEFFKILFKNKLLLSSNT